MRTSSESSAPVVAGSEENIYPWSLYVKRSQWPTEDELFEGGRYDHTSFGDLGFALRGYLEELAVLEAEAAKPLCRGQRPYGLSPKDKVKHAEHNLSRVYREIEFHKRLGLAKELDQAVAALTASPTRSPMHPVKSTSRLRH